MAPSQRPDAYVQLQQDIIRIAKQSITDLYARHPEWWDDPRSRANVESRMQCARDVLALLESYDIRYRSE